MIARLSILRALGGVLLGTALVASLLLFAASSRGADVTTFTVTSLHDEAGVETCEPNSDCTLREAIQSITEEEVEDARYKIVFTVEGTISLADQLILYSEEEGVEVEIEGPGTGQLIVDGADNGRVLTDRNVTLRMSGVTLTGGEESGLVDGGGGLLVVDASATLTDVHVTENEIGGSVEGGGIAVENGATLELVESVVDHNVSEAEMGGGVYVEAGSNATIRDSTIEANEAEEDAGGGIAAEQGGISIEGSTIKGNRSAEGGGGVWIGDPETGGVEIIGSLIEGNHSDTDGGGIKSESPLVLKRSTVAGNEGGGIAGAGSPIDIRNSTVAGNSAPQAGPAAGVSGADVTLVSSILYGNLRDGQPSDCEGTIASEGFNLLGSDAGCGWTGTTGDRVGEDPLLAPLGDYGGPTATMPPESRLSPAINHGQDPGNTDQRGFTRPVPAGGSNTDIGAVEVQAPSAEVVPSVSPDAELDAGETLSCDPGQWSEDTISDPALSYEWIRDPGGASEDLGSASTLELTAAMAGKEIVCRVTVDNGAVAVSASAAAVELEPGELGVSPADVQFGQQRVGDGPSAPRAVVVAATGGVPLELTEIVSTNAGVYPIDASGCSGQTLLRSSCEIEVSFDPDAPGPVAAAIEVRGGDVERQVVLGGTGIEPELGAAPPALSLPTTEVGAGSPAQEVVISNKGNGELAFGEVLVQGVNPGDFRIASESCAGASLGSGETCEVEVAFAPTAPGARAAQLVLTGADPGSVPLSGSAIAPGLAATPATLDFGSQPLDSGPTAPSALVLSNPGSAPTRIDSIAIEGPDAAEFGFAANGCIGGVLAPGAECLLRLTFDPAAAGPRGAQLVVSGELSVTVPLAGSGSEPLPPAPRLRFQRGRGPLVVDADGVVRLRFACVSVAGACRAGVKLLRAPGAGAGVPSRLAGKRVSVGAGDSRLVALRLNQAARRALARHGHLPAVLAGDGPAGSLRANLVLREGPRAGGSSRG